MTILRTVKRRSPLAGFAITSIVLMWTGLSAQSAEQQIVADASTALGGRERILAVKTLIVEGGGRDLNVGQSLRFDDLGLQSDVWQIREYKRAYDLANTRARFEAIREAQYPFYQGEAAPRLIQGLDGEIAFNVNAEGSATRIFGGQATGLAAGAVWWWRRRRSGAGGRQGPVIRLPDQEWLSRLGAPHSGGAGAVIQFGVTGQRL